jgi:hypothetical protein
MDGPKNSISYDDYVKGIPFLSTDEQIKLIKVLSSALQKSAGKKKTRNSIMALEGLGAKIWNVIDAQEFVRNERESWD